MCFHLIIPGPDQTLLSIVPSLIVKLNPLSIHSITRKIRPLTSCRPRTPAICTMSPLCNNGLAGSPLDRLGSEKYVVESPHRPRAVVTSIPSVNIIGMPPIASGLVSGVGTTTKSVSLTSFQLMSCRPSSGSLIL